MPPRNPEDWPHDFTQALNAGDLEAVVALYDPDARFVDRTGEILIGRDRIRDILAGLINSHTRLHSRAIKTVVVDNIALLYTDFDGTTIKASGSTAETAFKAIEVLRRQPDRTWRLVVGDPRGRI
jgi:uncharacterized protein (TIGR02246 family)